MKRFLVSNLFALILFVITIVAIMSLDLTKGYTSLLMLVLAIGVLVYAATRLLKFEKEDKTMPIINFDEHCIVNKRTGKLLYKFTSTEWNRLTLDEKYDMARWFTLT